MKTGEQSFSGSIDWQRSPESETLLLSAPLGQGVASLSRQRDGVLLRDSEGREYQARDAEALVREVVGITLPMQGLSWWVAGRPRPDAPFEVELDAQGQLSGLRQDDWNIQFSRYESRVQAGTEYSLPRKLRATRGESLEVRLVVDDWELP